MKPTRPLAQVLLRKAIVGYLIFAVGVTGLQLCFEYRNARQEIIRSLDSLARTFAPGVASALWDYQEDLLKSLAHGIGEHKLVEAVGISDFHGRINANWRAANDETTSPMNDATAAAQLAALLLLFVLTLLVLERLSRRQARFHHTANAPSARRACDYRAGGAGWRPAPVCCHCSWGFSFPPDS